MMSSNSKEIIDRVIGLEQFKNQKKSNSIQREKTTARTSNQSVGCSYKLTENLKNQYIKSLIHTQDSTNDKTQTSQPMKHVKYIFNSKPDNNKNFNNDSKKHLSSARSLLNQSLMSKPSYLNSQNYNCKNQNNICDNLKNCKSPQFVDKHITSCKGQLCKNQFTSSYQKFDITKLDFSSGFHKQKQQISASILHNDNNHYASLVSKSRANIKKIIELNRMVKENKNSQYTANKQKSSIERFADDIQIIERLRTGCFGTVFKAKIMSTGKFVAIKSFHYDRQFQQREQQICKMLHNPFIIKIYKIFYTTDMQTTQQQKQIIKPTQKPLKFTQPQKRIKTIPTKLSLTKLSKQILSASTIRFTSSVSEFPSQIQKQSQKEKKSNPVKEHIKEYHHVTNIVMDLYDCDLNDYIMMKNKTDNLTLKLFCYQMLRSVLYLHSNHICHRDIKPHNFLVKKHILVLGDFGSAKIMKGNKSSNVAYICSRYYRAPELILGYKFYDKSIDIWSLGTVMAELALGKNLFVGSNSIDQLAKIVRIIGQPDWRKISFMIDKIPKLPQGEPKGLKNLFSKEVSHLFIDLLENMLKFNPLQRITAGQALSHPFFDQLRDQQNFQQINKQMDIQHFLKFSRDQLKQNQHLKNKLTPSWATQGQKSQCVLKTNNYLRI